MTWEQFAAVITALSALLAVVIGNYVQLRKARSALNGRMSELLELTRRHSFAEGQIDAVGKLPTKESVECPTQCPVCGSSI